MELAGVKKSEAKKRAAELLKIVGLPDKPNAYPAQLLAASSKGRHCARLATDPEVLLCDEATSALDPQTTHSILELIKDINKKMGITVIIITHQMSVVEEICNHVAILDGGHVVEEGLVSDVFSAPKSAAAKRLVFPDGSNNPVKNSGERRIRVVFNGAYAAGKPLITQMAIDMGIAANILAASTKIIGDKVYGNMLLGLPDSDETLSSAKKYLTKIADVIVEEVTDDDYSISE